MAKGRIEHQIHRSFYFHLRKSEIIVLPNFYYGHYEMDLFCLNGKEEIVEYETKISLHDYKIDFLKSHFEGGYSEENRVFKHDQIRKGERCNKFYFVVPHELVSLDDVPSYAGLIYYGVNQLYSFRVIKRAPVLHNRKPSPDFYKKLVKTMAYRESNIRRKFYHNGR